MDEQHLTCSRFLQKHPFSQIIYYGEYFTPFSVAYSVDGTEPFGFYTS